MDDSNLESQRSSAGCVKLSGHGNCPCTGTNNQEVVEQNGEKVVMTSNLGPYPATYGTSCSTLATGRQPGGFLENSDGKTRLKIWRSKGGVHDLQAPGDHVPPPFDLQMFSLVFP